MIKYLFLDLDNTILDFNKAEAIAIRRTMTAYGAEPTDANAARYSEINDRNQLFSFLMRKQNLN